MSRHDRADLLVFLNRVQASLGHLAGPCGDWDLRGLWDTLSTAPRLRDRADQIVLSWVVLDVLERLRDHGCVAQTMTRTRIMHLLNHEDRADLRAEIARLQRAVRNRGRPRGSNLAAVAVTTVQVVARNPRTSLQSLAGRLGVSPSHLSRTLSTATGRGFRDHLTDARLHVATGLLLSSRLSIKEIAQASGFASVSVFDRQFRRQFRIVPTAYRSRAGPPQDD